MCSMHAFDTLANLFFHQCFDPLLVSQGGFLNCVFLQFQKKTGWPLFVSHTTGVGHPWIWVNLQGASRNVRRFWRSTRPIRFDSSLSRGLWQSGYVARPDKRSQGKLRFEDKKKQRTQRSSAYHIYIVKHSHIVWYSRWIDIFVFFWRHLDIFCNE